MAFYKKQVVRKDTPADIAWRFANNKAREQAKLEVAAKFPTLTPENFAEAIAYQEERIAALTAAILEGSRS